MLLTNGRSQSRHLDGLNGRDRLSGRRVEEDRIPGARVAAEFRPEGIALPFEQFALRWVETNRPLSGLLPSRHLALETPERMLRAGLQREHGQNADKTAEGLAERAG